MQPPSPPPNLTVAPPPPPPPAPSRSKTRLHGGQGPCAACRHQRRRCPPDCILLPYFPGDQRHKFERANRLFGVQRIVKILKKAAPELRDDAAKSIIFESNARADYPASGCQHFLLDLRRRIEIARAELQAVRRCIEIVRTNINNR